MENEGLSCLQHLRPICAPLNPMECEICDTTCAALHALWLPHSSTMASPAQSRVARGRCTPRRAQIRTCRRGGHQRVASVGPLLTTSLNTTPVSGDLTWLASDRG